jgi:hypothetical protein
VSGIFDVSIENLSNSFPNGKPVGADYHAATDRTVIGQLPFLDAIGVPAGVVLISRSDSHGGIRPFLLGASFAVWLRLGLGGVRLRRGIGHGKVFRILREIVLRGDVVTENLECAQIKTAGKVWSADHERV